MSELVHTIGIKVDPETYRIYKYELTGRQKDIVINTVRQVIIQLIRKPETIQSQSPKPELTLKIEHVVKDEAQFLELRKRLSRLERELANLLNENAGLKNELESCREQLKKPSDQLEKELAQIQKELAQAKKELENYKYYMTVVFTGLQEVKKTNDMSGLDKIIQYALSKIDNTAIERARLTAQNILK